MYFPLFVRDLCSFCYALLCVHSSFAIILKRKRELVALLLLPYRCIVTVNVLWLFLTVPWVVDLLFNVFPIVCERSVFDFFMHYFVSILVLQSS